MRKANILSNEKGNMAFVVVTMVVVTIGGALLAINQNSQDLSKITTDANRRSAADAVADKLSAFGSFMVSTGMIACKQDVFQRYRSFQVNTDPSDENFQSDNNSYFQNFLKRCEFTGRQMRNGALESITLADLHLSNPRYVGFLPDGTSRSTSANATDPEFAAIKFDIDLAKLFSGDPQAVPEGITLGPSTISFKLYDISPENDTLGIGPRVGTQTGVQNANDMDHFVVKINVDFTYDQDFGIGENGQREVKRNNKLQNTYTIRRPIAVPDIDVGRITCRTGCDSSISLNPNGECRGAMDFQNVGRASTTLTVTNQGPGLLYALTLNKRISYNPDFYPNPPETTNEGLDILGTRDYLLPGESIEITDSLQCLMVRTTVTRNVRCSSWATNPDGSRRCWDASGNPITDINQDGSGGTTTEFGQHSANGGEVLYGIDLENQTLLSDTSGVLKASMNQVDISYSSNPLDQNTINTVESTINASGGDGNVISNQLGLLSFPLGAPVGNYYESSSFRQETDAINNILSSMSHIEPKRLNTIIDVVNNVPVQQLVTVQVNIIPSH